jgi:endoglucanase
MFINMNGNAWLGYNGWAAGGFDTTYVLSETPTAGNGTANGTFMDQPIVKQCLVGTRMGTEITRR